MAPGETTVNGPAVAIRPGCPKDTTDNHWMARSTTQDATTAEVKQIGFATFRVVDGPRITYCRGSPPPGTGIITAKERSR